MVLDIVSPVLLAADDDGALLGLGAVDLEGGLQVLELLRAGEVAEDGLVLHLEVAHGDVGLGYHRGDAAGSQPGKGNCDALTKTF